MKLAPITIAIALAGCASQPATPTPPAPAPAPATVKEVPASALVDRAGDSVETAVIVPADAPDDGVRFENDWIYDRIGRFRRLSQGTGMMQGRRYDVITVETPKGDQHKYYFDITDNWARWQKPPQ